MWPGERGSEGEESGDPGWLVGTDPAVETPFDPSSWGRGRSGS